MQKTSPNSIPDAGTNNSTTLTEKSREYYQNNRERIAEYHRKRWRDPETQKKIKEYKKIWHQKNKEKAMAKATKWNKENSARRKEITKKYRDTNKEEINYKNKKYRREYRRLVLSHYSNGKFECNCCGIDIEQFLTIDHINGGGNKHRKETKTRGGHHFYFWLKSNDYPEGYQVLCFNCNMASGHYGQCPHKYQDSVYAVPENEITPL